jgi:protein O-GlcNAc transferase
LFNWAKNMVTRLRIDSDAAMKQIKNGNKLLADGNLQDAAACYERAIEADPRNADAYVNLGFTMRELGQDEVARGYLERALKIDPGQADAHYLLGQLAGKRKDGTAAIHHYEAAISAKPDFVIVYPELFRLHYFADRLKDAKRVVEKGIAIDPESPDLNFYLGNIRLIDKEPDQAIACYKKVLSFWPESAVTYSNLGKAYLAQGRVDEGVASYREALSLDDDVISLNARSSLLFIHGYRFEGVLSDYLTEARRYGSMLQARIRPFDSWSGGSLPNVPLRVGMVSGDFLKHPVGFFLESILDNIDSGKLELVAYPTVAKVDELTTRIKPFFKSWHSMAGLDDAAAANLIHADGIQVLIDLSGHTADNRLPVFAWKPAPVQVSWLGYFASTGVPGMDYLLADRLSVPETEQKYFTESIWYLPDTRLCFTPPCESNQIAVSSLPALRNGYPTFGCFQNASKINDEVLAVWGRIFHLQPEARLRVQNKQLIEESAKKSLVERLLQAGIPLANVTIKGPANREEYLAAYAEVDVILDTFPYPGGTTTCEALWMGVPTLTLAGTTMLARQGASMVTCAGLNDWIACNEDEYVAKAVAFSGRTGKLAELRAGLRDRVAKSPLFDAPRFARNLEDALLGMWRKYCDNSNNGR